MKKFLMLTIVAGLALSFNACKKDDNNNGGNNPGQTSCKLASLKSQTDNSATGYDGLVIKYNGDKISRANSIDSLGNEDSLNFVLFSYNGNNITDIKVYQDNALTIDFILLYDNNNRVTKRDFSIQIGNQTLPVKERYFYDANGHLAYMTRNAQGSVGPFSFDQTDSAVFSNYTSGGRPGIVTVFQTTSSTQGTEPYDFLEEYVYEYDANGNRTKESIREEPGGTLTLLRTATYDLAKTYGDAAEINNLVKRINPEDYQDINADSKDVDINLVVTETTYDGTTSESKVISYTFNDKNNPATSTEIVSSSAGTQTTVNTFTYECK